MTLALFVVMSNKVIHRENTSATKIFDDRSLAVDYRTLRQAIKPGMRVLDVGCGTGSITKDIAALVGPTGKVIGIDNTEKFIVAGNENLKDEVELIYINLFQYNPDQPFDLIVSARTMQWLSNVKEALLKLKSMLKEGGTLSILDYNHEKVEWNPEPPSTMKTFYAAFLKWRQEAGMNNHIADDLPELFAQAGFKDIEVFNSDEHYQRSDPNFVFRAGIWSKVGNLTQIAEEGYISEEGRLQAIKDYDQWVENTGVSMTMKLNEVRGKK